MTTKSLNTQSQQISVPPARDEEILAEATRAFAQNGFRATDVQVIADALGIGKGTIYRTFPTKQALFLACADRAMRRLQDSIHTASAHLTDPLERLKAAIAAYFQFFDDNSELLELIIQERSEFKDRQKPTYFEHRDRSVGQWNEMFASLIRDGEAINIEPSKITDFISQQLYGKLFTHYFTGSKTSLSQDADCVIDLLFHGFLTGRTTDQTQN